MNDSSMHDQLNGTWDEDVDDVDDVEEDGGVVEEVVEEAVEEVRVVEVRVGPNA